MSVRRTRAALFLALATVSFAATAAAQDAAGLVRAGVTARREGRDADALALFERAAQSDARASTLAQVGFALQALGRWAEAEAQLERVSALDDPWVLRHRDVIDGALVTVRSHLATLELACSPAGAEVFVDGRSIGVAPLARPVRLAAGSVTVTARMEGYFPAERAISIVAGDRARESIELRPRAPEPVEPVVRPTFVPVARSASPPSAPSRASTSIAPAPRRGGASWVAPTVVFAGGVVTTAVGAALVLVRDGALSSVRAAGCLETATAFECPSTLADLSLARREHEAAQSASAAATALVIVGGATAIGGVVWWIVDRATDRGADRGAGSRARVRPTIDGVSLWF